MSDEARNPWPAWARYTATAAIAFGGGVVALTVAWADVKRDAKTGAELQPRVNALELRAARDDERWSAIKATLERIEARLSK